ncbi:hypothetical protein [Nocardia niwae]|uniref:hypothetical protein n=1 Tax=Nocardia niwae TaxID=626084 RepID=UPI0007A428D0|nr:hypothetical protein [Nocardia niwae]
MPESIDDEKTETRPGSPAAAPAARGGPERGPTWARLRNLLIVTGDAVLVAVLIGAVVMLGERGTSLDFLVAARGH